MEHFCTTLEPMVFHIPGFGTFWLHERAENFNVYFAVWLEGVDILWLRVVHSDDMCLIGTIACLLRNIPPVSASADESTHFFLCLEDG